MNQNIHPVVLIIVIVIAVIGLSIWGYKAVQPAPYKPSPHMGVLPGAIPGSVIKSGGQPAITSPQIPGSAVSAQKK